MPKQHEGPRDYGSKQKDPKYSPLVAFHDSNFARETDEIEPDDSEAARCGYLAEPYVDAGPAKDSTYIRNTVPSRGSLGNDGTSRNSYQIQPNLVDADDPEEASEGTGIPERLGRGSIKKGEGHDVD